MSYKIEMKINLPGFFVTTCHGVDTLQGMSLFQAEDFDGKLIGNCISFADDWATSLVTAPKRDGYGSYGTNET